MLANTKEALNNSSLNYQSTKKVKCDFTFFFIFISLPAAENGDFIEAAGVSGVVEEIGIITTTMRTGDDKEIIAPNGALFGGVITNVSARVTRRVDMVFGIGYDDDIRKAKDIIRQILDEDERVLKDPAPLIAVGELADSSVNFNVRPWVKSGDYWGVYFDTHEKTSWRSMPRVFPFLTRRWTFTSMSLNRSI